MKWDDMPDFVVIAPYTDVPLIIETLDDYVQQDTIFCAKYRAQSKADGTSVSNVPATIAPFEKIIMGLETVACTREDVAADRYAKALLAYKPAADPTGDDFMGRGMTVAAYVYMRNKQAADQLLEQVARLIKPLK